MASLGIASFQNVPRPARGLHAPRERLERAYLLVNVASGPVPRHLAGSVRAADRVANVLHFDRIRDAVCRTSPAALVSISDHIRRAL
jgi:hypothetical protein